MSTSSDNVTIAITGAVYASEPGATITAPTTYNSALDTDLEDVGYISDAGIEEGYNDDRKVFHAWQGGAIVRTVISSSEQTFKFTMIESKRKVLELYHKGSTMVSDGVDGYKLDVMTPTVDRRAWLFDVIDGDEIERIFIEDGEVSDRGSIKYVSDDLTMYEVTVTSYPVDGRVCTKFSNRASWAPAA
jgi:hypothetical protein